jgi:hypothetical protein
MCWVPFLMLPNHPSESKSILSLRLSTSTHPSLVRVLKSSASASLHYSIYYFSFFQLRVRLQLLITAMNALESYAYNLCDSLTDEKLADKFKLGAADKAELEGASTIQVLRLSNGLMPLKKVRKRNTKRSKRRLRPLRFRFPFLRISLCCLFFSLALSCNNSVALRLAVPNNIS